MSPILASILMCRASLGFMSRSSGRHNAVRLFSVSKAANVNMGVSRLETLQTLLSKHGAPGSKGCAEKNDLDPVFVDSADEETPQLISELMGIDEYVNLHPHLYPLARSKSTGNLVCALRRAYADDTNEWYENSASAPWPIVEAKLGGLGMRLLALNSEHLMRRIVCECDSSGEGKELIDIYNEGLGKGKIKDTGLDQPYEPGSVDKLGVSISYLFDFCLCPHAMHVLIFYLLLKYGVDKYVLLRVGPFADIYETLALGHAQKGDESSALISAEAANNKISGFASTFLFYARLLNSFPSREEETRDAARMCLRIPLPSIGLSEEEFKQVAVLGQIADNSDSMPEVMAKLQRMYEKMKEHEEEQAKDPRQSQGKTPEQAAIDEASYLLDVVALSGGNWSEVRPKLAEIYRSVGQNEMADFVDPKNS